jgi:2-hydroxychromene-2-carboxylate isomerase
MVSAMTRVEFHFDFGSPNAYLCHVLIPSIEQRTGARFEYIPVLLGGVFKLTNNQPPMASMKGIRNKPEYQQVEMRRFIARHRIVRFRFNPHFPVNTLLIMRAAIAAEQDGALMPYADAAFRAMWEEGCKMDDPAVARDVLDRAGLDGAGLLARTQDQTVKDRLLANTERSVARGAFGSPTFFVGDEMFFGKDRLRDVEEEIAHPAAP